MNDELNVVNNPIEKEKAWEDLGRPDEPNQKPVWFAFTVYMDSNGNIKTDVHEPSDIIEKKATTFDVFSTCRDIVSDIESQMLATRVSQIVIEQLKEADPKAEAREKLLSALSNRGIDTPKA